MAASRGDTRQPAPRTAGPVEGQCHARVRHYGLPVITCIQRRGICIFCMASRPARRRERRGTVTRTRPDHRLDQREPVLDTSRLATRPDGRAACDHRPELWLVWRFRRRDLPVTACTFGRNAIALSGDRLAAHALGRPADRRPARHCACRSGAWRRGYKDRGTAGHAVPENPQRHP